MEFHAWAPLFYFPRRYLNLTTCVNNLHYEKFQDGTVKCIEDEIPFEVPEGWAWSRLVSLTAIITKGASPKWQGVDYTSSGTMFITSENVGVETLLLESPKFLPEKINKIQPRSILETHDILTNIVGASIGRTCEYTLVDSANTNQAVAIIRLIAVDMVSYVVKCLNSDYCVNLMFANQVNVARANLSLSSLANFLIPIPPLKEMYRIIAHLDCSLRHISGIQSSEDELRQLILFTKTKILDLAIRGQLVPQNPDDEPASVLLERIRAEKEELIKQGKIKLDKKESVIFKGDDNSYYEKIDGEVSCIDEEIPYNIPDTWTWVRLENCCVKEIRRGKSPKYAEISNVIVFAQKCNTKYNGIDISLAQYLDETTIKRYPTDEHMQDGDIVINSTGTGTLGRVGIYRNTDNTTGLLIVPDSHVTVIRSFSCISSYYLYAFMKAHQTELEKKGEGSTNQKELKPLTLKEMLIAVPPISEQKRINKSINVAFSHLAIIEKCLN